MLFSEIYAGHRSFEFLLGDGDGDERPECMYRRSIMTSSECSPPESTILDVILSALSQNYSRPVPAPAGCGVLLLWLYTFVEEIFRSHSHI
jgi:hypothetical protein